MTNQEAFKQQTKELYNKLNEYKRRYSFMDTGSGKFSRGVLSSAVSQLRLGLEIVYTDEESSAEHRRDGMC